MKDFYEHKKENERKHREFERVNDQQQMVLDEMKKKLDEIKDQVDEIYQWVTTGKLGYFGVLKFFAFVGVVSGGIIGVISLFKKIIK